MQIDPSEGAVLNTQHPFSLWLSLTMRSDVHFGVIIPAGGSGKRFGSPIPKQYLPVVGIPSIVRSVVTVLDLQQCSSVVIAAAEDQHGHLRDLLATFNVNDKRIHIVDGGKERQISVAKALRHDSLASVDIIAVHDAVRPLATRSLWERVIHTAQVCGAAIPAIPVADTLKRVSGDVVVETINRADFRRIQTPQAFDSAVLRRAYQVADEDGWTGTDCASLCERLGIVVHCVEGEESNIKITTPFDVVIAEAFLARN